MQVWLKLTKWFWKRCRKCKKKNNQVYGQTDGQTYGAKQQVIRKALLSFQLMWPKKIRQQKYILLIQTLQQKQNIDIYNYRNHSAWDHSLQYTRQSSNHLLNSEFHRIIWSSAKVDDDCLRRWSRFSGKHSQMHIISSTPAEASKDKSMKITK